MLSPQDEDAPYSEPGQHLPGKMKQGKAGEGQKLAEINSLRYQSSYFC